MRIIVSGLLLILGLHSFVGPPCKSYAAPVRRTKAAPKSRAKARPKSPVKALPRVPRVPVAPRQPPVQAKSPSHPVKGFNGQCVGILNGDTIVVSDDNYEQVKVRLYGVAAPDRKQPFGPEATQFISSLIFLKRVMVYNQGQDSDGTLLAWVFVATKQGQVSVNRELVRNGYAWWNRPQAPGEMMLGLTEAEAKGSKLGLWSRNSPVAPWEFRAQMQSEDKK